MEVVLVASVIASENSQQPTLKVYTRCGSITQSTWIASPAYPGWRRRLPPVNGPRASPDDPGSWPMSSKQRPDMPLPERGRALLRTPAFPAPASYGIERLILGHPSFGGREIHREPQRVPVRSLPHLRPDHRPSEPPGGFHAVIAIHQQEPVIGLEHHYRRQLIEDLRIPGDPVLIEVARRTGEGIAGQRGDLDIHRASIAPPAPGHQVRSPGADRSGGGQARQR